VLDVADLEMNVLEFRQRAFQFERVAEVDGVAYAVFSRTETESESRFRPQLVHLRLVVPQAWVVHDETNDVLLLSKDGTTLPVRLTETVVEVGAEPSEFREQGIAFKRGSSPGHAIVYAPAELAPRMFAPEGLTALGIE
jgi:hypothetical protein